ncbi:MAG: Crp/Fnr family transcriptional regulator [Rhizorhabdus sp.]
MSNSPLDLMVDKLSTRVVLSEADRSAILALPHELRTFDAAAYVVREGEKPRSHCDFIEKGFAFRQKLTSEGARQIVSLHMRGDFLDLQHLFLNVADHNVQALTKLNVVGIERDALQTMALERPVVARAMWVDALVDASISREWVMNVGRRDARARIAHVLCEFALRMKAAGFASDQGYELPLTQEQLADVVGLTPVHVSRMLKSLEYDGIVQRNRRFISFRDWDVVATVGDFSALYLHLDQAVSRA